MIYRAARRSLVALLVGGATLAGVGAVANWPVTTRQGANYEVRSHRLPLYHKAFQFVDRSMQYQQLADEVTRGVTGDEERVLAAFAWTRRSVREVPDGYPVVDDHILNIIIRGYGMPDQQADVFATLCAYAGVPAFWTALKSVELGRGRVLTFVSLTGAWRVFDVAAGVIFRRPDGPLATFEELQRHPEWIPAAATAVDLGGVSYSDLMRHMVAPSVPHPLRAELQMPGRRLWHELKVTVGIEPRHESQ